MRLMTWNINSLVGTVRNFVLTHGSFQGWFLKHRLDIACIQEAKVPEAKLTKDIVCVDGFQSFWAFSRAKLGYSGVTTYAAESWSPVSAESDCLGTGEEDFDLEGRVVCTDHGAFVLINVYVPNAGGGPIKTRLQTKLRFLTALKLKADAFTSSGRQVLIVGDMNVAVEAIDIHPRIGTPESVYGEEACSLFMTLTSSYPDVWRRLHPDIGSVYTVWDEKTFARSINTGLRIDFVLASPGLLGHIVSCEVINTPPKWSDHTAIIIELEGLEPPPAHPPCALSSSRMKRFNDRSQPSMASMFGKKRSAGESADDKRPAKKPASGSFPVKTLFDEGTPLINGSLPAPTDGVSPDEITVNLVSKGTSQDSAAGVSERNSDTAVIAAESGRIDSETQMPSASDGGEGLGDMSAARNAELVGTQSQIVNGLVSQGLKGRNSQQRTNGKSKTPVKLDKGQRSMQSFFAKKSGK